MATELEKKWVDLMREAEEANSDFGRAIRLEMIYNGLEESSFRSLVEHAGFKYRTARYLVGIMEDADRLSYPLEDVHKLMHKIGWTKTSHILRDLTRKRSVLRASHRPRPEHGVSCHWSSHARDRRGLRIRSRTL